MQDKSSILVAVGLLGCLLLFARGCPTDNPPGPGQTARLAELAILVVEDSTIRTPEQAALLADPAFRAWANATAARLRVADVRAVRPDGQPSTLLGPWRTHVAAAGIQANESSALPALLLVRSDGSVYRAARLPDSLDAVKRWVDSQTLK